MKTVKFGLILSAIMVLLPAHADWSCTMQGTSYSAIGPSSDAATNAVYAVCKRNNDSCFKSVMCQPVSQSTSSTTLDPAPPRGGFGGGYGHRRQARRQEVISATIQKSITSSDCNADRISDFDLNQNPGYDNAAYIKIKLAQLLDSKCQRVRAYCDLDHMEVRATFIPSTGGGLVTSLGTCTITGSVLGE